MDVADHPERLCGCPACGQVQGIPGQPGTGVARWVCCRCGHRLRERHIDRHWPGALAIAGLICYPVAMWLPILEVEKLGYRQAAGVLDGSLTLMAHGQWLVGGVVFLVSVVLPLIKLFGLVTLCFGSRYLRPHLRAKTWHLMELIGRWGMLDVLLVAVLVAVIKIGDLATVTAGPGAVAFTVLVLVNLLAAMTFDPHALWEDHE